MKLAFRIVLLFALSLSTGTSFAQTNDEDDDAFFEIDPSGMTQEQKNEYVRKYVEKVFSLKETKTEPEPEVQPSPSPVPSAPPSPDPKKSEEEEKKALRARHRRERQIANQTKKNLRWAAGVRDLVDDLNRDLPHQKAALGEAMADAVRIEANIQRSKTPYTETGLASGTEGIHPSPSPEAIEIGH